MKNNTTLIMAAVITTVAFTVSALAWSQQPQQTQALAEWESSTTSCIDNQPCHTSVWNSSTPDSSNSSTPHSPKSNHNKVSSSITCMNNNQPCHTSAANSTASIPQNYPPIEDELSSALDDLTG
jgi:hypothetical protein